MQTTLKGNALRALTLTIVSPLIGALAYCGILFLLGQSPGLNRDSDYVLVAKVGAVGAMAVAVIFMLVFAVGTKSHLMRENDISKFVATASWLAAILTGLVTVLWVWLVVDGKNRWDAAIIWQIMSILFGGGILVLGVAPSVALYLHKRQRGDLLSLLLAGCSLVILLVETILLVWVIPQ